MRSRRKGGDGIAGHIFTTGWDSKMNGATFLDTMRWEHRVENNFLAEGVGAAGLF